VKRSARQIVEKYYQRLTMDFQTNKRICEDVAIIPSKRLKNKIAGFATVRPRSRARPCPTPAPARSEQRYARASQASASHRARTSTLAARGCAPRST